MDEPPTFSGVELRGMHFRPPAAQSAIRSVRSGDGLMIVREPHNQYDSNAIAVYVEDHHAAYIAREVAAECSPWIDKGIMYWCSVESAVPCNYRNHVAHISVRLTPLKPKHKAVTVSREKVKENEDA